MHTCSIPGVTETVVVDVTVVDVNDNAPLFDISTGTSPLIILGVPETASPNYTVAILHVSPLCVYGPCTCMFQDVILLVTSFHGLCSAI
jgi:hypothetical protein